MGLDKEEATEVLEEKNVLLQNILDIKEQQGLDLVDNKDFINWATTYRGPEGEDNPGVILFEPVALAFLSVAGASLKTTTEELDPALTTLY